GRAQFFLDSRLTRDGPTYRANFEQYERQTKRRKDELHPDPLPPQISHLWDWFLDLRAGYPSELAIPFAEIAAWRDLYRLQIRAWEIAAIRKLDDAYRSQAVENLKRWISQR
ncbi:MAG: phage tail assembly chaperone, partial [Stellaceae bacterium]